MRNFKQNRAISESSLTGLCLRGVWIIAVAGLPLLASDIAATMPAKHVVDAGAVHPGYRIGPGDILQINVWKEPEASVTAAAVRSDGIISLPLIKEVSVRGLTPSELESLLTQKFSKLIRDADVTVVVKEIHSEMIYLIGGVKKEGPIPLQAPITVLQAVAQAGGLTDYAKRSKIYVLRQEKGSQTRFSFNYDEVLKGEHMERNINLLPGDTVVVPQ